MSSDLEPSSDDLGRTLPFHPVWIAAFLVMGPIHARFAILMHEAAHRLLFPNRKLNDFVGKWLIAYPAFVPFALYRRGHFAHHKEEFGANEPDLNFYVGYPISRASLGRKLRRYVYVRPKKTDGASGTIDSSVSRRCREERDPQCWRANQDNPYTPSEIAPRRVSVRRHRPWVTAGSAPCPRRGSGSRSSLCFRAMQICPRLLTRQPTQRSRRCAMYSATPRLRSRSGC